LGGKDVGFSLGNFPHFYTKENQTFCNVLPNGSDVTLIFEANFPEVNLSKELFTENIPMNTIIYIDEFENGDLKAILHPGSDALKVVDYRINSNLININKYYLICFEWAKRTNVDVFPYFRGVRDDRLLQVSALRILFSEFIHKFYV